MNALDGLVVLDLSRGYPGGCYTAMYLGDFGAEVIKIDPIGNQLPHPGGIDSRAEYFVSFYAPDRNKQSMELNMHTERGKEIFLSLVEKSDVLIEGFRPGVMDKLGVGYPVIKKVNPRIIYCAETGFGQSGPYASIPGHDMNYLAIAGALNQIGPKDGPPCFPSNYIADMAGAGLNGVIGILLALAARDKTGKGQFVDISYLDGVLSLMTMDALDYFMGDEESPRGEGYLTGKLACIQAVKCKDGKYFTIACLEPKYWKNLCFALGRKDLIPYHLDQQKQDYVKKELQNVFLKRTRDEWWQQFKNEDVCVAPVLNYSEAFTDSHILHRNMVIDIDHKTIGKVRQIGIAVKLSETPGKIRSLAHCPGADTDNILNQLGYSHEQIANLREQKIVN